MNLKVRAQVSDKECLYPLSDTKDRGLNGATGYPFRDVLLKMKKGKEGEEAPGTGRAGEAGMRLGDWQQGLLKLPLEEESL